VIKAGACIEASFKRGKGEAGMDEYQVRTWEGWHHHMALTLIAAWFLIEETHRGQQWTPALTRPQVRYGLSMLLLEVFCTPGIDSICRQVHRQLLRNELARFYHHRTRLVYATEEVTPRHTVGLARKYFLDSTFSDTYHAVLAHVSGSRSSGIHAMQKMRLIPRGAGASSSYYEQWKVGTRGYVDAESMQKGITSWRTVQDSRRWRKAPYL
jgi:hypothetical protein